jgi:hypothetical protein
MRCDATPGLLPMYAIYMNSLNCVANDDDAGATVSRR